jgi:Na+-translocating ferredoxin:NAD+ oxidoreductase RnfD subunit
LFAPLLIIYAFFMITDPKTAPSTVQGRTAYAFGLALGDQFLRMAGFGSASLFIALFFACALQPFMVLWRERH